MIDKIVEMIFKEARSKEGLSLTTRTYMVLSEVCQRVSEMLLNFESEERRRVSDDR